MSLWTPGGEHEVPREPAQPAGAPSSPPPQGAQGAPGGGMPQSLGEMIPGFDEMSPEEQAQAEAMVREMAEAQAQIAQTPASDIVANHVMGFYELAAIHLSSQPPKMDDAALAIDAMVAVMDNLQGRLGENEPTLVQARSQLQMAYVEVKKVMEAATEG